MLSSSLWNESIKEKRKHVFLFRSIRFYCYIARTHKRDGGRWRLLCSRSHFRARLHYPFFSNFHPTLRKYCLPVCLFHFFFFFSFFHYLSMKFAWEYLFFFSALAEKMSEKKVIKKSEDGNGSRLTELCPSNSSLRPSSNGLKVP